MILTLYELVLTYLLTACSGVILRIALLVIENKSYKTIDWFLVNHLVIQTMCMSCFCCCIFVAQHVQTIETRQMNTCVTGYSVGK